jgi:hypothetical protein
MVCGWYGMWMVCVWYVYGMGMCMCRCMVYEISTTK